MARIRIRVDRDVTDLELARVPVAGDFIRLTQSRTVEAKAVRLLAGADYDAQVQAQEAAGEELGFGADWGD